MIQYSVDSVSEHRGEKAMHEIGMERKRNWGTGERRSELDLIKMHCIHAWSSQIIKTVFVSKANSMSRFGVRRLTCYSYQCCLCSSCMEPQSAVFTHCFCTIIILNSCLSLHANLACLVPMGRRACVLLCEHMGWRKNFHVLSSYVSGVCLASGLKVANWVILNMVKVCLISGSHFLHLHKEQDARGAS